MIAVDIEPEGVDIRPPNFALLAAAYGYTHHHVSDLDGLKTVLGDFASKRQVMVIEVSAESFE
jgi:thiamine pyrophosphate-dependent acetolactate synthase large subunit-like protein